MVLGSLIASIAFCEKGAANPALANATLDNNAWSNPVLLSGKRVGELKEKLPVYSTFTFSEAPFLVVTNTTPSAARAP